MTPQTDDPRHPASLDVTDGDAGRRLDVFVASHIDGLSRARAHQLIKDGSITVDGRASKPSAPVAAGAKIVITIPAATPGGPASEDLPVTILYRGRGPGRDRQTGGDGRPPGRGTRAGTLVNALLHHLTGLSGIGGGTPWHRASPRQGHVGRDGRGQARPRTRRPREAVPGPHGAQGLPWRWSGAGLGPGRCSIDADRPRPAQPVENVGTCHARASRRHEPLSTGRTARRRVARDLTIGTGRTHQIRVHLAEAGFPVVGDAAVRRRTRAPAAPPSPPIAGSTRPFLHAARLEFTHPLRSAADGLRGAAAGGSRERPRDLRRRGHGSSSESRRCHERRQRQRSMRARVSLDAGARRSGRRSHAVS